MDTRIVRVVAQPFEIELFQSFAISGGTEDVARVAVVAVTLANGVTGLGEAAPLPAYNGETLEQALGCIARAGDLLLGSEASAWRDLALRLKAALPESGAARCALEMAIHDALARSHGVPLQVWFGGRSGCQLQTDVTIPICAPTETTRLAKSWAEAGFGCLKLKVGADEHDLERVLAARVGAPAAILSLDANAGMTAASAVALLEGLSARGVSISLFEQPVAKQDWEGLRAVAKHVRVALDESVVTAADALTAAAQLGSPHVINVKLMKAGIREALDVVAVARAAGMGLMIGGMLESSLAMTVSACFASALEGFEFVDLDTPLFLRNSPFTGGYQIRAAELSIGHLTLGHGVTLLGLVSRASLARL